MCTVPELVLCGTTLTYELLIIATEVGVSMQRTSRGGKQKNTRTRIVLLRLGSTSGMRVFLFSKFQLHHHKEKFYNVFFTEF